jgi:hypothetical protein
MWRMRAIGGTLYLLGALILMIVNLFKTAGQGSFEAETEVQAPPMDAHPVSHETHPTSTAGWSANPCSSPCWP